MSFLKNKIENEKRLKELYVWIDLNLNTLG